MGRMMHAFVRGQTSRKTAEPQHGLGRPAGAVGGWRSARMYSGSELPWNAIGNTTVSAC